MLTDDAPATLVPGSFAAPAVRPPHSARKWQSADKQRGFTWAEVAGYHYHPAGTPGNPLTSLYVFLAGGILRLTGTEAETVWEELVG